VRVGDELLDIAQGVAGGFTGAEAGGAQVNGIRAAVDRGAAGFQVTGRG
jgi:hypothetical protein